MDIQDIVTQLKALDGQLPYEALQAVIVQREQIIPELLQIIEQAKANPEYMLKEQDYMGHIYAMYLLAQFRETSAYPLIVEFFSVTPAEITRDITEDIIDKLGCVLASVCGGDDRLMKSLLENENANEYARSEAVVGLITLVAHGQKSREEVITYFQSLFRSKLKREGAGVLWSSLVFHSIDLHPEELYEDIKQAFADELVDPFFGDIETVENQLAMNKADLLKCLPEKYPLLDHAIAEIEKCIYFYSYSSEEETQKVTEVMLELTHNTGVFPREALTQTIALRQQIIPRLLELIQYANKNYQEVEEQENFIGHIYALYLLAQFREQRAYPLIISFFSLPGEISLDITGDVVTEDLHRILASVYDGDDIPLKNLVENPNINGYVRDAALRTFLVLVACGQKTREEVMEYFQSLFKGKLERQFSQAWNSLVVCCLELYPEEVDADIQQAYADDLVENFYVTPNEVERSYALGKQKVLEELQNNHSNTLINDTIQEMEKWACFKPSTPPKTVKPSKTKSKKSKKEKPASRISEPRKGPKVGRNEPCPCGSGKKYKKCCG